MLAVIALVFGAPKKAPSPAGPADDPDASPVLLQLGGRDPVPRAPLAAGVAAPASAGAALALAAGREGERGGEKREDKGEAHW